MRWCCCWNDLKLKKRQNFYAKIISFNKATHTWDNRQLFVPFCSEACGHKRSLYFFKKVFIFCIFSFFFNFEKSYYLTSNSVNCYFLLIISLFCTQRHYNWTLCSLLCTRNTLHESVKAAGLNHESQQSIRRCSDNQR